MYSRMLLARHPAGLRVLCCAFALLAVSTLAQAGRPLSVEGTAEWGRLGELWNTMTDHSSGAIYSLERFRRLTPSLDRADADLTTLIGERRLPTDIGEALRRLFHARYSYITDYFYLARSQSDRTTYEAAQTTSQWVVELQLSLLRAQLRAAKPDAKMLRGSQDSLAAELTFQRQCAALSESMAQRRKQLTEKEQQKQKVDWNAFDNECQRQERTLAERYQKGRPSPDRAVRRMLPYLLSLSRPSQVVESDE